MKVSEASMRFVFDGLQTTVLLVPFQCVFAALIQKLTEIIIYIHNHSTKVFLSKLIKNYE